VRRFSQCRGCPATVSGEFLVMCHWESRSWKATQGIDPRARRPAVSRGHTRRCRSGSTDISFTNCCEHMGETWFAVTWPLTSYRGPSHVFRIVAAPAASRLSACIHRSWAILSLVLPRQAQQSTSNRYRHRDQLTEDQTRTRAKPITDEDPVRAVSHRRYRKPPTQTSRQRPARRIAREWRSGCQAVQRHRRRLRHRHHVQKISRALRLKRAEIIAQTPGVQLKSLYGGVNAQGPRSTCVDLVLLPVRTLSSYERPQAQ